MISLISSIDRPDSLAQQAYRAIRKAIQDGIIVHEEFYSEGELAKSMGISRTPVREALIELSNEGLVEIVPQRGFRLRIISPEERKEIFELRRVLEAYVVERLAQTATPEDVEELRAVLEDQSKLLNDADEFLAVDEQFHLLMPRLAGLDRTLQLIASLRGAMWLLGNEALALPQRTPHVLEEHTAVVNAIEGGDVQRAVDAIHIHLKATARAAEHADQATEQGDHL